LTSFAQQEPGRAAPIGPARPGSIPRVNQRTGMPTYEYKCSACGHAFEQFQSITAAPLKRCPSCGKAKVKRLLGTGAGIIFKGSGFYITDYRDASYKEKAKAESGATAGDAKSDGQAESKPAADTKSESRPAEVKPTATEKPATPKPVPKSDKKSKK
jgi:putative FmdB family regulatory protein